VRVVSLVPSLTEGLAAMGLADRLVGVTDWCEVGAPAAIIDLAPDLVLVNDEENRLPDVERLRAAGLEVLVTSPRTVEDVAPMLREVARALGAGEVAEPFAAEVEAGADAADAAAPRTPIAALTLIWRKPWMAVGPDTYVDDLLRRCGFANVLAGWDDRYPTLDPSLILRPEVVLLPSEPYAFSEEDVPAVRELLGDVGHRLVDGRLLTWHGPSTGRALRTFSALAAELDGQR
jgi:ABC-type Fe3+-hydroxamate transport system substrate-binding protein